MDLRASCGAIWCDTDAGFDDLLALGALARSGNLHFVTTVSGACEDARVGALRVRGMLRAVGCGTIPVVPGLDAPQVPNLEWLTSARATLISWAEEQRLTDLETTLHAATTAEDDAPTMQAALRNFLQSAEGNSVRLLALGPLSNIANVLSTPECAELVQQKVGGITIMGGNQIVTKPRRDYPEFNFMCDPAAAAAVFSSSFLTPLINVVGVDVCTANDPAHKDGVERLSQGSDILCSLVRTNWYASVADPLAAFCSLYPDRIEWCALQLAIDPTSGVVAADNSGARPNIQVAASVIERVKYFDWLVQCASLGQQPPCRSQI